MLNFAARLTAIYLAISVAWIIGSDRFVNAAFSPDVAAQAQTYKGLFFVIGSALLIYVLSARFERKEEEAKHKMAVSKARAERASSAKSVFLSHMSHELRTPLNAIVGYSEVMQSEMFGPVENDRYKEYIDAINTSSSHLSDLLSDVLDLSQIESGDSVLHLEVTDVSAELAAVGAMLAEHAARKGIAYDHAVEGEIVASSNPVRLRQIVTNLLSNAIRHTDEGSVRLSAWKTGGETGGNTGGGIRIEVADTGSGIDPAQLENIRDMLALGSPTYQREQFEPGRTGLGLVISSRLVRLLGGRMEMTSEIGKGTTVTLAFDRADAAALPGEERRRAV